MKKNNLKFFSTNPNIQDRPMDERDTLHFLKNLLRPKNKFWRKKKVKKFSELSAESKKHINEILKRNKR